MNLNITQQWVNVITRWNINLVVIKSSIRIFGRTWRSRSFQIMGSWRRNNISFFRYKMWIPLFPFCARRRWAGSRGYIPLMIHNVRKSFNDNWSLFKAARLVTYLAPSPDWNWRKTFAYNSTFQNKYLHTFFFCIGIFRRIQFQIITPALFTQSKRSTKRVVYKIIKWHITFKI